MTTSNKTNYSEGKRKFGLTRSFLVNYLRWASLCSCCDMLSIYTLLMFVLLLSSFIEAQHHSYERSHPNRAQVVSTETSAVKAVELIGRSNRTLAHSARMRANRSQREFPWPDDDDHNQPQQRLLTGVDRLDLVEPLNEAGSEVAPIETPEQYEILRLNKSRNSRAPSGKIQATQPAAHQTKNYKHSKEQLAGVNRQQIQGSQSVRQKKPDSMTKTSIKRPGTAITNKRRPSGEALIGQRASGSSKPLEPQESHWIPMTGTPTVGSHAAGVLLDYPLPPQRPPPPAHSDVPLAYGQRRPLEQPALVGRPQFGGSSRNSYAAHMQYHSHWPRRRPRFHNEPQDNEIGAPPLQTPGKLYKRVLLCDKTLVSLDYIRSGGLLPGPPFGGGPIDTNRLDEHEINEISDSFLDLEGQLESSMSRLNLVRANRTSQTTAPTSNQNSSSGPQLHQAVANALNESSNAKFERLSMEQSSNSIQMDRRSDSQLYWPAALSGNQLLSDEDPLVRCDMWDLEKGLKSRKPPRDILHMAIKADFDTVREAINRCRQLSERTLPPEDETGRDGLEMIMSAEDLVSLFSMKRGLMPGTKWCGLGDQASQYNDLGPKHRIDICCRAHDHCPIRSKPFRNDYGILNIGLYTKSHCDCDADFYRCLREVRSRTADMLGNLYFNVMKLQCMREERLQVCREAKPIALGFERCIRYEDQSPIKTVFKFTTPPVAY